MTKFVDREGLDKVLRSYSKFLAKRVVENLDDYTLYESRLAKFGESLKALPFPLVGFTNLAKSAGGDTRVRKVKQQLIDFAEEVIVDHVNIAEFIARYSKKTKLIKQEITAPIPDNIGRRFSQFLRERGASDRDIAKELNLFLQQELPEFTALSAVRELREQYRSEKVRVTKPYPGRRSGVEAVAYLMEHYGDDIRSGLLGPGKLQKLDQNLYIGVQAELSQRTPPQTIGEFFDVNTAETKKGSPFQRRVRACAELLDTTEEDSARFFSGMRADRVKKSREPHSRAR